MSSGLSACRYLLLQLQNCNHWQDKFFVGILLRQQEQRQLYYYNIVTGVVAFKSNERVYRAVTNGPERIKISA